MNESNSSRSKLLQDYKKSIESFGSTDSSEESQMVTVNNDKKEQLAEINDDLQQELVQKIKHKKRGEQKKKIFRNEMKKAFQSSDKEYQVNFLKIYKIYGIDIDIFEEWVKQKKQNLFQFISFAFINSLIPNEKRFLARIISLFESNKEDSKVIESFKKFRLGKTDSYTNIQKGNLIRKT